MSRALLVSLFALSCACTYEFGNVARIDGGIPSTSDSGRLCDPIAREGCVGGAWCSAYALTGGDARITCSTTGGTSLPGDDCAGTGICRPDLICRGSTPGTGVCETWCTESTDCPAGGTCNRAITLFVHGERSAHPCE